MQSLHWQKSIIWFLSLSFWRKREKRKDNIVQKVAHLTNHILHKIVQTHSTLYIVTKIYKSLEEHTNINMSFFAHIERSYKEGVTLNLSVCKKEARERAGGQGVGTGYCWLLRRRLKGHLKAYEKTAVQLLKICISCFL